MNPPAKDRLRAELWTSWASLLRSYAAAHGLNSRLHAVVEVSENEITMRAGSHWIRFTHSSLQHSEDEEATPFALLENGKVRMDDAEQEMDFAAEWFARELMQGASLNG